ncbi:histidine phosphatase family protein [Paenibacillus tepidiphilus]|uniref:histidine phosphatase family protein n=1 Tax=Paenibacillus tepidiphilus TaxID=2608683 RepID=UPI0013A56680|nr:histidine phosphatase family protein [Paenibacillus tepidiphilus]
MSETPKLPDFSIVPANSVTPGSSIIEIELVLVRHGHTSWNLERRYLGSTDLPLLPEATQALAALREHGALQGEFWRVYCSDLRRCRETLALLTDKADAVATYDPRLREMDFGAWEGCDYGQLQNNELYRAWIDDPQAVAPPGGESWISFTGRLEDWLEEIKLAAMELRAAQACSNNPPQPHEPQRLRVLAVTHGGVIRHILAAAAEAGDFRAAIAPPPGTPVTVILSGQEGTWEWGLPGAG